MLPSGTLTFLFTDIEGSTQRWDRDRAAMQEAVRRHDTILRTAIEGSGGRVFKTIGDAFCAVFPRAEEAVAAAMSAQRALAVEDFSAVDGVRVRMALHTGTADERDGDYYGPTLNRVARLLSIGHGGQVLLSRITAELVRDSLPPGVTSHDMGLHKLKDLSDPELVHQLLAEDLSREFPPLKSSVATPNNLPEQLSTFVGRETESAEVEALLRERRLITLLGTGGIGKTRLSLHVASQTFDEFPNGVWFVEFAPIADAALVPDTIATAMGLQESPGRSPLDNVVANLKNDAELLILDNCEHLVADIAKAAAAILKACSKVKILASSREPLNVPGEHAYRMPTLGPSEAIALFAERAKAVDSRFELTPENEPAVGEICRRLDGIALAIELAAARVKLLSIKALNEKLDDRFRVLTGGSKTLLPRQQTLRALIDWSYDLLSENERVLFRRLAIFSGGFTLEMAGKVCADDVLDEFEIMDLLGSLVDKSLVYGEIVEEEKRYGLLESIREYAREKLTQADEVEAMSRAHAAAYTDLAEQLEAGVEAMPEKEWSALARPELENWRAALTWALTKAGDHARGRQLAAALRQVWTKFALAEGRRWIRIAIEDAQPENEHTGRLSVALAHLSMNSTEYQDALAAARRALDVLPGDNARLRAEAEMFAGAAMGPLGQREEGERWLTSSLEAFRRLGVRRAIGTALGYLVHVRLSGGDVAGARPLIAEALDIYRSLPGGGRVAAHLSLTLAEIEFQSGNFEAALGLAKEALAADRVLSKEDGVVFDLCNIAAYQVALGQIQEAAQTAGEALALAGESGIDFAALLALQHVAAIGALYAWEDGKAHELRRASARILGFVDRRFAEIGFRRYFTEQHEYDAVLAALRNALSESDLAAALSAGGSSSQERAVEEAAEILARSAAAPR